MFQNLEEKLSWHAKCSLSVSIRGSKTLCVFLTANSTDFLIRDSADLGRRTTEDSSCRRIMRLVPVLTLETNNQTNNECLPKFVQTDNASSSIKTAIGNPANAFQMATSKQLLLERAQRLVTGLAEKLVKPHFGYVRDGVFAIALEKGSE